MQHFSSLDIAGLETVGIMLVACLIGIVLTRPKRNRRIAPPRYREIGFTACRPAEGASLCQKKR